MSLLASLHETIKSLLKPTRTFFLGLSGGMDSMVLFDLCRQLQAHLPFSFTVIHVNHGVANNANEWQQHCQQQCALYHVPYVTETLTLPCTQGQSLEAVLRDARYAVFAKHLKPMDVLLTAHHQDDQAETVLLQLFRGAGIKGISAMPQQKPFANGLHIRPLLPFSRKTLLAYAKERALTWVDDRSNEETRFARNYIRHAVLPVIEARWPQVAATITRSAKYCAEAQAMLDEISFAMLPLVKGSQSETLSVNRLLQQSERMQRLLLRAWIIAQKASIPNSRKIHSIMDHVLGAARDAMPRVDWDDYSVRRYRDDLYLTPRKVVSLKGEHYAWSSSDSLIIPALGRLSRAKIVGAGITPHLQGLIVRFRSGGEVIKKGGVTQSLKKLFQGWGVPPWMRERIPLLYFNDTLIAVVGYHIHDDYQVNQTEPGHQVTLLSA